MILAGSTSSPGQSARTRSATTLKGFINTIMVEEASCVPASHTETTSGFDSSALAESAARFSIDQSRSTSTLLLVMGVMRLDVSRSEIIQNLDFYGQKWTQFLRRGAKRVDPPHSGTM